MQGKSNKQIAFALGVSERTIEFHLKNIYAKLQVTSRVELILALGRATGDFTGILGQTTVDILPNDDHNDKQPASRWAQPLKNIIFTTKKEFAMFKTIVIENIESFLRKHPLLLSSMLFVVVSFLVRYLIIDIGLYLWFSYFALGISLLMGSLYFGMSWRKIVYEKNQYTPLQDGHFSGIVTSVYCISRCNLALCNCENYWSSIYYRYRHF